MCIRDRLYEGGYVYALNELADQYDPYFYKVVDGSVIKWHTKEDGNLYACLLYTSRCV